MTNVDLPAVLDLVGTLLSIAGGILAVVPAFREAKFLALTDGIKSWIAEKEELHAPITSGTADGQEDREELEVLNTSIKDAELALRDLRNSNVRFLKVGIILLTVGLVISLPAKWGASVDDPCAKVEHCRTRR